MHSTGYISVSVTPKLERGTKCRAAAAALACMYRAARAYQACPVLRRPKVAAHPGTASVMRWGAEPAGGRLREASCREPVPSWPCAVPKQRPPLGCWQPTAFRGRTRSAEGQTLVRHQRFALGGVRLTAGSHCGPRSELRASLAGADAMPRQEIRTEESPEAAVRKHCPPQAAGEEARQNCESQTFVICVAADANGMAANATSRTARSSILASRCRARPAVYLRAALLSVQDGPVFKHQDCQAVTQLGEVRAVEISSNVPRKSIVRRSGNLQALAAESCRFPLSDRQTARSASGGHLRQYDARRGAPVGPVSQRRCSGHPPCSGGLDSHHHQRAALTTGSPDEPAGVHAVCPRLLKHAARMRVLQHSTSAVPAHSRQWPASRPCPHVGTQADLRLRGGLLCSRRLDACAQLAAAEDLRDTDAELISRYFGSRGGIGIAPPTLEDGPRAASGRRGGLPLLLRCGLAWSTLVRQHSISCTPRTTAPVLVVHYVPCDDAHQCVIVCFAGHQLSL